jgi:adiponectin receptor
MVPAIHACILHGLARMFQMGFLYLCIMAATYITGGVAYALRVPERFFPGRNPSILLMSFIRHHVYTILFLGRFDIVGHSHQILHVAVIAAVYLHFYSICCLFHSIMETEQCLTPMILDGAMINRSLTLSNS